MCELPDRDIVCAEKIVISRRSVIPVGRTFRESLVCQIRCRGALPLESAVLGNISRVFESRVVQAIHHDLNDQDQ